MNPKNGNYDLQDLSQFFIAVQPVLVKLETNTGEDNLTYLLEHIKNAPTAVLKVMENKLLCPLIGIIINGSTPPGVRSKTLDCISTIVAVTKIYNLDAFVRLYTLTCKQIFCVNDCALDKILPEELKVSVMECLRTLITCLQEDFLLQVYDEPMTRVLSQGVLLAAQIVKTEKSLKVRCSALEFLLVLAQYGSDKADLVERVSNTFIHFIPGLVSPFSEIICKEKNIHHQIIRGTIRCWGHVLWLALRDIPHEEPCLSDAQVIQSWMAGSTTRDIEEQSNWLRILSEPKRTRQWTIAAAGTLHNVIGQVASHHGHPHLRVRLEMVSVLRRLLCDCSGSLGAHAGPLMDALVVLAGDECSQVKEAAVDAIAALQTGKTTTLRQVAQERLPDVVTQLAKHLRSTDTTEIDRTLQMLKGYLDSFQAGQDGPCIISNPLLLKKLLPVLQAAARLRLSPKILHQHDLDPADFERYDWTWNDYHMSDKMSVATVEQICYHVANWAMENTVSLLIDDFRREDECTLESIAVLNMAVRGWVAPKSYLVQSLFQFYLQVNTEVEFYSDATPKERQVSVMKIVLAMQGLASLATAIGADFEKYLLQSFYSVVERVGNSYSIVRAAALSAAAAIASSCQVDTISGLIEANVDYLTHHIALKLKRTSDVAVLDAVRVMARLCPAKALPQLQHIVGQILSSSSAHFKSPHIGSHLRVFLAFIQCAAGSSFRREGGIVNEALKSPAKRLMEYVRKQEAERCEEQLSEDNQDETESKCAPEEDPPTPELPLHASVAVQVVRRCLHYLPVCTDHEKVLCLEVLNTGLQVFSEWENVLLPVVHDIWSPLVRRFDRGATPLVISRSFTLLRTLCSLSKDFIRQRTLKEVLPALWEYLIRSAPLSRNQTSKSAFCTTQGYKLQRELLSGLGTMTCDLRLRERETYLVVEAALPYLSEQQHPVLQECAVSLYTSVLRHHPHLVVHRLIPLAGSQEFHQNVKIILRPV